MCYYSDMTATNITLKIESDLARDARVLAAQRGPSLSRLVTEQLRHLVREEQAYAAARQSALGRLEKGLQLDWEKPGSRADLHDRENLR